MTDQTLLLPKGRQADCVLTTRIVNELPGFTSCALTQNMYSADGKVLLLERGSEVSGEYGVSSQLGLRRLFIVWTRVRTPSGVEVDLRSPGADALGTSGVPGHLEQRWTERIGAALLLSVMRDAFELEIARQQADRSSSSTVVLGPTPGGNTMQAGQDIGEQVVKQTLNVKPTLHIAEGARISIHVARDLDFSPVYALRSDRAALSLDSSFTGRTP
jgi:type IV secretion system protein VirB10